jgi:transposase InsO family protein
LLEGALMVRRYTPHGTRSHSKGLLGGNKGRSQVRRALFDYVEGFYDTWRSHSALAYQSPALKLDRALRGAETA